MRFVAILLMASAVFAAEPSAYRAGNISGADSYGLTESEKAIRANKQAINKLEGRVLALEQQLSRMSDIVDALNQSNRTYAETITNLRREIERQNETLKENSETIAELQGLSARQDALEKQVNKALGDQAKNQQKLAKSLEKIAKKDDNGSKEKLEKSEKSDKKSDKNSTKSDKSEKSEKPANFDNAKPDELLNEAKAMIEKRDLDNAYNRLSYLIGKKHKIGETTYLLGVLYYFKKDYQLALKAFARSVSEDDKARHMPVLLYYSGICNERLKKTKEAIEFYESVLRLYPDHSVAKGTKERLDKLKS
ncbi:MAG: tetratricopeptide repeat protein [Helicobacteraceae bacterium]|jgi:TolA-binding protein|nr:tetratricopeptide repeat protein [Helicobacteraceae bacterium]